MAFPLNPSKGETYSFRGIVYTWSGTSWTYEEPGFKEKSPTITKTYAGPFGTERELGAIETYRGQGDGDTYSTIQDTIGNAHFVMYNMTAADIVNDVP